MLRSRRGRTDAEAEELLGHLAQHLPEWLTLSSAGAGQGAGGPTPTRYVRIARRCVLTCYPCRSVLRMFHVLIAYAGATLPLYPYLKVLGMHHLRNSRRCYLELVPKTGSASRKLSRSHIHGVTEHIQYTLHCK